ncbi:hypothetical protein [Haloferula sp. A504]|uniref:hypothetical protein n=1 Tax=Haloferula sp. A504 TaxID=3373601 RepID=UPI0031C2F20F|nr:hypothetical protein [Verrucomicrobiaceae bacterium E54]
MKSIPSFHTAVAIAAMAILSANGQVVVEQYLNLGTAAGTGSASFNFNTVTADNSVLLIAIGSEVHTFESVTFDGNELTPAFESNDVGLRESYIFALDLGNEVATSGLSIDMEFTDTLNGASGFGVSVLQVSNADFSSLAGGSSGGGDITVPALAAGSLILDVVGSNSVAAGNLLPSGLTRTTLLAQQQLSSASSRSSLISNTTGGGVVGWTGESGGSNSAIWIEAITTSDPSTLALADFTYDPADGSAEVSIVGAANTNYKLVEADDLDFSNPDQNPIPLTAASVGTLDGNEVTTDASGNATVQFNLGTAKAATFLRAETAP